MPVLEARNVTKHFPVQTGLEALFSREQDYVKAINGLSLDIDNGQIHGLVGESGCGKSTFAKLILRIHELTDGEIRIDGSDHAGYPKKEFYRKVQMIFQDPFKSLNPRMKVYDQMEEILKIHGIPNKRERVIECFDVANLSPPEQYLDKFPHELSGGERQRVSIARALLLDPSIIIADEPVSMLDVSIRASILELFSELSETQDISILYISHDLATVRNICEEISVMYLGKIVETGPARHILENPTHPYTKLLMEATPVPDPDADREKVLLENTPDSVDLPTGCYFKNRCPLAVPKCDEESMNLRDPHAATDEDHKVACHRAVDEGEDFSRELVEIP